eukprot:2780197-Prymnesium_polylepis.2
MLPGSRAVLGRYATDSLGVRVSAEVRRGGRYNHQIKHQIKTTTGLSDPLRGLLRPRRRKPDVPSSSSLTAAGARCPRRRPRPVSAADLHP